VRQFGWHTESLRQKDRGGFYRPFLTEKKPPMDFPAALHYTQSHEWVQLNADGTATVGITAYAQDHLGEVVYAEPPAVGSQVTRGTVCGVVESTKAAADVYSPVTGTVLEFNAALGDSPQTINEAPYAAGWFFKVKLADLTDRTGLMDAAAYAAVVASEA
jgi:glycine cleavage system H protein